MTDDEFKTWAKHHATLFLMTTEQDLALFAAWKPLILPYDLQEFLDGSNYLASEKASTFRTTHLDQIRERVHRERNERTRRILEQEALAAGREDCRTCFGGGIATVPHLLHVRDGEWIPPYRTTGIFCHCSLGQAKFQSLVEGIQKARESKKRDVWIPPEPLPWAKYEALVPNWAVLLAWRENLRQDEIHARNIARHADLTSPLEKIFGRIKALPAHQPLRTA